MKELIMEIVAYIAPIIMGIFTSIVIPCVIKKQSLKSLQKKIDEVNEQKEFKDVKKELAEIKREILEMRGKIK